MGTNLVVRCEEATPAQFHDVERVVTSNDGQVVHTVHAVSVRSRARHNTRDGNGDIAQAKPAGT